ncbi:phosphoribosylglycinamide formyltransferase [Flavobacteriaceae bacterium]|nr:phosphoribosylglycinamide formyltransferase [Flavobacteriaceae bacterium]
MKKKIVIFISGRGTNALNIISEFRDSDKISVIKVYSNNENSTFLKGQNNLKTNISYFSNDQLSLQVFEELKIIDPDLIVLAGFLKKIPTIYIDYFKDKIINIHPSLLPSYGGKGMYGSKIHNKVIENNEKETGITIHYVNNEYDSGEIIFQKNICIEENDTVTSLEEKIHKLEYEYYPKVIQSLLIK